MNMSSVMYMFESNVLADFLYVLSLLHDVKNESF